MSTRKKTIRVEPIVKKRESSSITTLVIIDSLRVGLEKKLNQLKINKR